MLTNVINNNKVQEKQKKEALFIKKNFGLWLKRKREERDLTVRQLAKFSGVSSGYISQVERGKRNTPTQKILLKLAKPLKISLQEIYEAAGLYDTLTKYQDKIAEESPNYNFVKATHRKVPVLVSEDELETIERFLKIAREEFNREKGK